MSFIHGTEEYYQKFIELQEKLRKSEEERLKLEMKFNEMMQHTREEEQAYYKKLRLKYKIFLEEDRRRQERNEKILRILERIESRAAVIAKKTERFKLLRRQYQEYLKRMCNKPFGVGSTTIPEESQKARYEVSNARRSLFEEKPTTNSVADTKEDIIRKYLQSLNQQNGDKRSDLGVSSVNPRLDKPSLNYSKRGLGEESFYRGENNNTIYGSDPPNYASSIANDILSTIYSKSKKVDYAKPSRQNTDIWDKWKSSNEDNHQNQKLSESLNNLRKSLDDLNTETDDKESNTPSETKDYPIGDSFAKAPYDIRPKLQKDYVKFNLDNNEYVSKYNDDNLQSLSNPTKKFDYNLNGKFNDSKKYVDSAAKIEQLDADKYDEKRYSIGDESTEDDIVSVKEVDKTDELKPANEMENAELIKENNAASTDIKDLEGNTLKVTNETKPVEDLPIDADTISSHADEKIESNQPCEKAESPKTINDKIEEIPQSSHVNVQEQSQAQAQYPDQQYTEQYSQNGYDQSGQYYQHPQQQQNYSQQYYRQPASRPAARGAGQFRYWQRIHKNINKIIQNPYMFSYDPNSQYQQHAQQYQQAGYQQPQEQYDQNQGYDANQQYYDNSQQYYGQNQTPQYDEYGNAIQYDSQGQAVQNYGYDEYGQPQQQFSPPKEYPAQVQPTSSSNISRQSSEKQLKTPSPTPVETTQLSPDNDKAPSPTPRKSLSPSDSLKETLSGAEEKEKDESKESSPKITSPKQESSPKAGSKPSSPIPKEVTNTKSLSPEPINQKPTSPIQNESQKLGESSTPEKSISRNKSPSKSPVLEKTPSQKSLSPQQAVSPKSEPHSPKSLPQEAAPQAPVADPNLQEQYSEQYLQYDEHGNPIQYDEYGQPIYMYPDGSQYGAGYDPNAAQYDEYGQPVLQYDETGQPIYTYDQYQDPNQYPQYEMSNQPQYDEHGQIIESQYPAGYQENYQHQPTQQEEAPKPISRQNSASKEDKSPIKEQDKTNVMDMLETDTESTKQDITKVSNESDFEFSNS